ncbi:MAG: hypothetical protein N3A63_05490 [Bacteroidetes bacterium]|nr:hypothetical protein [Bacteroidota bacterium]
MNGTIKPYLVLVGVTTILSIATSAVLYYTQPTFIHKLPSGISSVRGVMDTTQQQATQGNTPQDTLTLKRSPIVWEDTVAILRKELAARDRKIAELTRQIQSYSTHIDSNKIARELQYAKLLEAMRPEEAAKVLSNFNDADMKAILLKMKTKQASKIVAALEPKRVARIMK